MIQTEKYDYTVPQFAKLISCSSGTVKKWIKAGKIKAYRIGGETGRDYRIPWEEGERIKADWTYPLDTKQAL
jgi:excisionase family DNA binding protein